MKTPLVSEPSRGRTGTPIAQILSVVAAVALVLSCSHASVTPVTRTELTLGTTVTISVYQKINEKVLDRAFARVNEIDKTMNRVGDGSEIAKVNAQAGTGPVVVTPDVYDVVRTGIHFGELTDGAFDITVGPLVALWGIGTDDAHLPTQAEIAKVLPLVDYRLVTLNDADHSIYLQKKGMQIDLGGIAKGYAADEAARILSEAGVKSAILDFGGNILVIGSKPDGDPWRVGIQTPDKPRGNYLGIVRTSNRTIVTSGPYERYFVVDGVRYHHIFDPKIGYPTQNHLISVTIESDDSMLADAMSTSAFVLGLKKGHDFVEGYKGMDAIFVTDSGSVYFTSGLDGVFTLDDPSYHRESFPADSGSTESTSPSS